MSARGFLVFVIAVAIGAAGTYVVLKQPEWFSKAYERTIQAVAPPSTPGANRQAAGGQSKPVPYLRSKSKCGGRPPEEANARVLGGGRAHIKDWPGLVSLRMTRTKADGKKDSMYFCSGILIHKNWVVTAAHCITSPKIDHLIGEVEGRYVELKNQPVFKKGAELEIIEGREDLRNDKSEKVLLAKSIIVHDPYTGVGNGNDIALIELQSPATGKTMRLSTSPSADPSDKNGTNVFVAGFGKVESNQADDLLPELTDAKNTAWAFTHNLRENYLPLVDNNACEKSAGWKIFPNQICAGDKKRDQDSCNADSGGPLVRLDAEECPILVGVVSYGIGLVCGQAGVPGVYTRISAFKDWINKKTSGVQIAGVDRPGDMAALAAVDESINGAIGRSIGAGGGPRSEAEVTVSLLPSNTLKIGEFMQIAVTAKKTSGYAVVLDVNSEGKMTFLIPNKVDHQYESPFIEEGKTVVFGAETAAFRFMTDVPPGEGRVIAIVSPEKGLWRRLQDKLKERDPTIMERSIKVVAPPDASVSDPLLYDLGKGGEAGENWTLGYTVYNLSPK